jgi:hypothetical protein
MTATERRAKARSSLQRQGRSVPTREADGGDGAARQRRTLI